METKPKIVCLCGSTRFREAFQKAFYDEEHKGNVVLTVPCYKNDPCCKTSVDHARLDRLHLYKIGIADEVLVLDVDGYIGESTANEIRHAKSIGRHIRFLSEETGTMVPQDGSDANG